MAGGSLAGGVAEGEGGCRAKDSFDPVYFFPLRSSISRARIYSGGILFIIIVSYHTIANLRFEA